MSKGFLVSLEGPEGAGKTSVLEALLPILEEKGVEVLTTREPGGVLIGEKIREVIWIQVILRWMLRQSSFSISPVADSTWWK